MSKHSGENTLLQIFENVKDLTDSLRDSIESKQEPFIVTATADFVNGKLTNVSHTFVQIEDACNRGNHVFLDVDISQLASGQRLFIDLTVHKPGVVAVFDQTMKEFNGSIIFARGLIYFDNTNTFTFEELAKQTQLNGLTFKTSTSVPTVDDRSVITFAIEG